MLELDEALAALDPPTAEGVRPAVEHLVGGPVERVPLSNVNQSDLQHFLWWVLPGEWHADGEYDRHEIAWALGDLFDAAGVKRYAEICRGQRTHAVLAAWRRSVEEGRRASDAAEHEAGVRPPETDLLTFGEVMGPEEARVHAAVTELLEAAIVEGRLDPAARGFRGAARTTVERFLRAPPGSEESPVTRVRLERAAFWAHRLGDAPVWKELLPRLDAEPRTPARPDLAVTEAAALLEAVGDGVALTKSGYLPPALALALDARFGWSEDYGHARPRGESEIPPLGFLNEHLQAQRLLTRRGNRLTMSARGGRAAGDPEELWKTLATPAPRWRTGFQADAVAITAALLLAEDGRTGKDLCEETTVLLARKWQAPADGDIHDVVWWIQVEWYRVGIVLGWWERRRGRLGLGRTLSADGRAAAATAFWSVAARPMSR